MEMKVMLITIAIIAFAFGMPALIKLLFKISGLSRIPQEFEADRAQVVCRSNTYGYAFVMILCGGATIVFVLCAIRLLGIGEPAGICMIFFAILFSCMFLGLFLTMKNRVILFFTDKIIFRDCLGRVFYYNKQQVVGYSYVRVKSNRSMKLRMDDNRNIRIDDEGSGFKDAIKFVRLNYPRG